jgi:hypothetical protein
MIGKQQSALLALNGRVAELEQSAAASTAEKRTAVTSGNNTNNGRIPTKPQQTASGKRERKRNNNDGTTTSGDDTDTTTSPSIGSGIARRQTASSVARKPYPATAAVTAMSSSAKKPTKPRIGLMEGVTLEKERQDRAKEKRAFEEKITSLETKLMIERETRETIEKHNALLIAEQKAFVHDEQLPDGDDNDDTADNAKPKSSRQITKHKDEDDDDAMNEIEGSVPGSGGSSSGEHKHASAASLATATISSSSTASLTTSTTTVRRSSGGGEVSVGNDDVGHWRARYRRAMADQAALEAERKLLASGRQYWEESYSQLREEWQRALSEADRAKDTINELRDAADDSQQEKMELTRKIGTLTSQIERLQSQLSRAQVMAQEATAAATAATAMAEAATATAAAATIKSNTPAGNSNIGGGLSPIAERNDEDGEEVQRRLQSQLQTMERRWHDEHTNRLHEVLQLNEQLKAANNHRQRLEQQLGDLQLRLSGSGSHSNGQKDTDLNAMSQRLSTLEQQIRTSHDEYTTIQQRLIESEEQRHQLNQSLLISEQKQQQLANKLLSTLQHVERLTTTTPSPLPATIDTKSHRAPPTSGSNDKGSSSQALPSSSEVEVRAVARRVRRMARRQEHERLQRELSLLSTRVEEQRQIIDVYHLPSLISFSFPIVT